MENFYPFLLFLIIYPQINQVGVVENTKYKWAIEPKRLRGIKRNGMKSIEKQNKISPSLTTRT